VINFETNPNLKTEFDLDLLERAALTTLTNQDEEGDISIVLTDDLQLQQLNHDFLGIDAPTDVLSFPASETDPETGRRYLGDILVSVPRAEDQAGSAGHALEDEVQLLIVHGTLHLLGHDHAEAEEKDRMWKAQAEVMARIGLPHIRVRE